MAVSLALDLAGVRLSALPLHFLKGTERNWLVMFLGILRYASTSASVSASCLRSPSENCCKVLSRVSHLRVGVSYGSFVFLHICTIITCIHLILKKATRRFYFTPIEPSAYQAAFRQPG